LTPIGDPGLQPERTGLAWTRTALALAGNAVLVLRVGLLGADRAVTAAGALLVLAAGWVAVAGWRRPLRITKAVRAGGHPLHVGIVQATAAATGLAAVAALIAVRG
jgi:uncharacterized membrane protein YidH (DUF202 family)